MHWDKDTLLFTLNLILCQVEAITTNQEAPEEVPATKVTRASGMPLIKANPAMANKLEVNPQLVKVNQAISLQTETLVWIRNLNSLYSYM